VVAEKTTSGSSQEGIFSQVCALVVPSALEIVMARASEKVSFSRVSRPSSSRWYGSGSTMAIRPSAASSPTASAQPSIVPAVDGSRSSMRRSIFPPSRRLSAMLRAS